MIETDTLQLRKQRGAFFTPYAIAQHLADWALRGQGNSGLVLDPSCGDGVFLVAAAERLRNEGRSGRLFGVDIHAGSLEQTKLSLDIGSSNPESSLLLGDFFNELTPGQFGARLPFVDAVIGNPPFIRYQGQNLSSRQSGSAAALAQGVRISGLASSWAPLLVHSSAFLKPDGRIAMVLPAELLSVGYAEPIRQWLKRRFRSVHLVLFEELQFSGVEEQVVLLVARGTGGCNAFTLHHVSNSSELKDLHIYDADAFAPQAVGKWTDLLIPEEARGVLRRITDDSFTPLSDYATCELGTVTGANSFFTMSDATKREYKFQEGRQVQRCVPPGTKHLRGLHFTEAQWEQSRLDGLRVWMLNPTTNSQSGALATYLKVGVALKVPEAYKCTVRSPWWKPPVVEPPDLFFTYMSHIAPRLITNDCDATFVNSMHGVSLRPREQRWLKQAIPVMSLNSVTLLGAEIVGRAYGGGILKLEPTEAAAMPLPDRDAMKAAWEILKPQRSKINELVSSGMWNAASLEVDEALLTSTLNIERSKQDTIRSALYKIRSRRIGKSDAS
jgi:adenine-specific DNA methylase